MAHLTLPVLMAASLAYFATGGKLANHCQNFDHLRVAVNRHQACCGRLEATKATEVGGSTDLSQASRNHRD